MIVSKSSNLLSERMEKVKVGIYTVSAVRVHTENPFLYYTRVAVITEKQFQEAMI